MPQCKKCLKTVPPDMIENNLCVFCETGNNFIRINGEEIPKDFILNEYLEFLDNVAKTGNVKQIIDKEKEKVGQKTT